MRILVADDNPVSAKLLSGLLHKLGFNVLSAADGAEAWDILQREEINIVITDWMMPNMDGLELCKKIRGAGFSNYIYIIMLTSKDEKNDLIKGMEAGADDFVVKPFNKDELNVRVEAGKRIIKLEKDLEEHNRKLNEANRKVNEAYSLIKKDLEASARVQLSLLPKPDTVLFNVQLDWFFLPCTFVAGDIFNYFKLDEYHVGFYLLDVAGHGISAALLSVTLSKVLSYSGLHENLLKHSTPENPNNAITTPAMVVRDLNQRFQADEDTMQYFTIIYGVINIKTGKTRITQAGHPSPILLKKGEKACLIGTGGYAVGLFPDVDYEEHEFLLQKGDRFILYSDGITECANLENVQFSNERLMMLFEDGRDTPLRDLMIRIKHNIREWKGNDEFEDDVTLLSMEII